jgi:hypothetical protein
MQDECGLVHWAFLAHLGAVRGATAEALTSWAASYLGRPITLIKAAVPELPHSFSSLVTLEKGKGYILIIRTDLAPRAQSEEAAHHLAHVLIKDHPDRAAYATPDAAGAMPGCSWGR